MKVQHIITAVMILGFGIISLNCEGVAKLFHGQKPEPPVMYTVIFNANGGSGTVPPPQTAEQGTSIMLPAGSGLSNGNVLAFTGWNMNNSGTGTNYNAGVSYTVTGDVTLYANWDLPYKPGDLGPGGGRIFYRSVEGFIMTDNQAVCHYLETVPLGEYYWGAISNIPGTSDGLGAGRRNTALILAAETDAPAAKACDNYSGGGKNDWFLPSKDELNLIYINRSYLGNVGTGYHWSSSQYQYGSDSAWSQNFSTGGQTWTSGQAYYGGNGKSFIFSVRAVRAF